MSYQIKTLALSSSLIACFGHGALAQDAVCEGLGTQAQWIGGSSELSDIATRETYAEQMALVLAGTEYMARFDLSAPATIRAEAQGRGAGDPLFDIVDATGAILVSDDDSGGEGSARAEIDLPPGSYCVAVSSFDGGPMTAFVRVGLTSHDPLTAGVAQPTSTGGGGAGSCLEGLMIGDVDGSVSTVNSVADAPYLRFNLTRSMPISILAENEDADPLVRLYDSANSYIGENDDFDGLNSRLDISETLAVGEYCIEMEALSDATAPVTVTVEEYDPAAALAALYGQGEAAPPMDGSVAIADLGELERRIRQDALITDQAIWYSLELVEGGLFVVEAISPDGSGDPWVAIYDDLGREVGRNDDYGPGFDSFVAARILPGTYLIAVKEVSADVQSQVRMVFERYVLAP